MPCTKTIMMHYGYFMTTIHVNQSDVTQKSPVYCDPNYACTRARARKDYIYTRMRLIAYKFNLC